MFDLLKTISIDDLAANAAAEIDTLQASKNAVYVRDDDGIVAIMMHRGHHTRLRSELDLLLQLLAGELEIDKGNTRDLESVVAAAELLQETGPSENPVDDAN